MTGAGAPGGPGIIKALKKDKNICLHVCDVNPRASGRYLNRSRFFTIPKANSADFIAEILAQCVKKNIQVVFPLVTMELFQLSEHKALFENAGIKVLVSDKENLNIANNKSRLCQHLKGNGILTPDFEVVKAGDFQGFLQAFKTLGYPERPLCVKPSISNGSRGVRIIDESVNKFDLLFHHKPNALYMTFNEMTEILRAHSEDTSRNNQEKMGRGHIFPELLISEVLTGEEYTIDTIVNQGKPELILPRVRTKMNNGISVEGQFIENQEIIDYCFQILTSLKLHGNIGIQVKRAVDGRFKILEINPRIQGTSVAAMGLGINLPLLAVKQEMGEKLDIPPIKWGTCFSRYYQEVFYNYK